MRKNHVNWLLAMALLLMLSTALFSQQINRPDVIWARTSAAPIVLDGVLDEAAWAQAESLHVRYGIPDAPIPGSGWAKEGGAEPSDPVDATLKFLVQGNSLYLAVVAKDSSVGGGLWARFDAILMNLRNAADANRPAGSFEYFYGWVAESWADPNTANVGAAPGFFGMAAADRTVWDAVTKVNGVTNDDAMPDGGHVTEFKFDLTVRGYDATAAEGTIIPFNISIYDCDWQWPMNEAKFSSGRAWAQGPWGNASAYAVIQIHANPAVGLASALPYVGPDFIVPNADTHPEPVVDGVLDEAAWSSAPGIDLRFGDDALRASYPGVAPLMSGQWQPEIGGVKAPVLDPADATLKWFTRGDMLYLSADVRDQAVWSIDAYDQWDGIRFILNDIKLRDPNDNNLVRRELTVRFDPAGSTLYQDHLSYVIDSLGMGAAKVTMKPGTTVNDFNDIDAGYLVEIAVDLKALGYNTGLLEGNLFISATLFDGDNFPNAADNYGQRVWFMREGGFNAGPAWGYMDPYTTLPGGTVVQNERPDAVWARTISAPITVDGKMDEAIWDKAESVRLRYGRSSNIVPGSGYGKEGGVDPSDPTDATLKFLVKENKLYLGIDVQDASVGGGLWARFDAFLFNIRDHSNANRPADSYEFFYGWVAESWADPNTANVGAAPGFFGRSPADRDLWNGVTVVDGVANDDTTPDNGYVTEFVIDLAKLGYDVTKPGGDIVEFNFSIYDCDWQWPLSDNLSSNRVWWQGPWGNASAYAIARIYADPSVTEESALPKIGPDMVVPNGANHAAPVIDGLFDDTAWANVPGLDIRFGDDELRNSYPGIAPWRSGQFQPQIDGVQAPVLDPADATLKWFFKDHMLYVAADFRDQSVNGLETFDMWDGLRLIINDAAAIDPNDNNMVRRNLTVRVGPTGPIVTDYLEGMVNEGSATVGFALKPNTTIGDYNDIDEGYHLELALDLTALGYPADRGDGALFISATIFDGDTFPNAADNYGQRVWFMRESDWPAGPAWAFMDPNTFVPGDSYNAMERPDAVWARATATPITLDGKMDEPEWAKAEQVVLRSGTASLMPGSGFAKEGGVDPIDPTFATLKFLVNANKLYLGVDVKDASVGGGLWARFDAFLFNIRDHSNANRPADSYEFFYGWVAESWADPNTANVGAGPGYFGRSPADRDLWTAVTVVDGVTNDDSTPDKGYVTEFVFDLAKLGYDVTKPGGDIVEFNFTIYDCDWQWPLTDNLSSDRVWWQGPWGNASAYAIARIYADPSVTVNSGTLPVIGPDFVIQNGVDFPHPTIDGKLDEAVWAGTEANELRFGDDELRAGYHHIGPWRSGQFQPQIDGVQAPVLDPADATIKSFFKDHMLYLSADVKDQSVTSIDTYDMWDGVRFIIEDRATHDPNDHNLVRRTFTARVGLGGVIVSEYLETLVNEGKAYASLMLNTGTTVNDANDIDNGYQIEIGIDLTALGYPADRGDGVLFFSATLFDGDTFPNVADNYGQRVWYMRESDWPAGPAWGLMDPNAKVTTDVKIDPLTQLPAEFALLGNYPNPFNPTTTIRFAMPEEALVTLKVYDLLGRMLTEKALGRQAAGVQEVSFDAARIGSGVYFYRLEMISAKAKKTVRTDVHKMLVIK